MMKKVLAIAAAVVLVAVLTSCDKKCTCTTTIGGITSESEINVSELNEKYGTDIKKCSEFNTNGITCKATL